MNRISLSRLARIQSQNFLLKILVESQLDDLTQEKTHRYVSL